MVFDYYAFLFSSGTEYVSVFYQSWKDLCHCSLSAVSILQSALKTLLMTSEDQLEVLPRLILVSVLLVGVEGVCPPSSDLYEDTVKFLKSCFWHSDKEVILYTLISMEIFEWKYL